VHLPLRAIKEESKQVKQYVEEMQVRQGVIQEVQLPKEVA